MRDIVKITIPVDLISRIDNIRPSGESVTSWIIKTLRTEVTKEELNK